MTLGIPLYPEYTPSPVSDVPVSVQNPAIDGHSIRLSTELNNSQAHVAVNDNITKFQNLDFDPIMSIRLKIIDIDPKVPRTCLTAPACSGFRQAGPLDLGQSTC